jgi:predicted dehydrogenase/threonine dehydrogenase-like Zn-dependent dehydrogenase
MKQLIQRIGSHEIELVDVPDPACKPGGIVVRTVASLISAGTERAVVDFARKSFVGKAQARPDLLKKVVGRVLREGLGATLSAVRSGLQQSVPLGYSSAGIVEAVGRGAEEFRPGDLVACAGGGYATHSEVVFVPRNLAVVVPDGVAAEDAAYVTLGAIALHGVRTADPRLGDWIAVIGLGLLGQLTVQLLKAHGCRVIAIDLDVDKVALAVKLGAELGAVRSEDLPRLVRDRTSGNGADGVVITAAATTNDPIELAAELCRERGRVTMVGAVGMDLPRDPFYMKELDFRISRSYGPGRYDPAYEEQGRDYPIGYVRWTERRNLEEFIRLVSVGAVTPGALTTHRFPIEEARQAYALVTGGGPAPYMGIVFSYRPTTPDGNRRERILRPRVQRDGATRVAFIGAGSFATSTLLPKFAERKDVALHTIATATGLSGVKVGERFGFGKATTDAESVFEDPDIDLVVIATRHGSHARFAAAGLRAGKAVFVEKPLSIDEAGLAEVVAAQAETGMPLFVGFNRRFAPLAVQARAEFAPETRLAINYRINAGYIPPKTWVHDPLDGGGRIIGEVCHFIDLCQFLAGDTPSEVFAHALGGSEGALHDTVSITVKFRGGSIAVIAYFATGSAGLPKERVEVFGGGRVAVIDDFKELTVATGGKVSHRRHNSQDKGFAGEVAALLEAVRSSHQPSIGLPSLVATTRATFAVEESLRTGRPVTISED